MESRVLNCPKKWTRYALDYFWEEPWVNKVFLINIIFQAAHIALEEQENFEWVEIYSNWFQRKRREKERFWNEKIIVDNGILAKNRAITVKQDIESHSFNFKNQGPSRKS